MFTNWIKPPAAVPCIARAAINIRMLTLVAAMTEPAANITTAPSRAGFRPQISESFAHIGAAAASASRNAPPIQK